MHYFGMNWMLGRDDGAAAWLPRAHASMMWFIAPATVNPCDLLNCSIVSSVSTVMVNLTWRPPYTVGRPFFRASLSSIMLNPALIF